jgi:hypothetical protein
VHAWSYLDWNRFCWSLLVRASPVAEPTDSRGTAYARRQVEYDRAGPRVNGKPDLSGIWQIQARWPYRPLAFAGKYRTGSRQGEWSTRAYQLAPSLWIIRSGKNYLCCGFHTLVRAV